MRSRKIQWGGLTLAALWLSGCASYYTPKPLYLQSPERLPIHVTIPNTQVTLGIVFCDTPALVHFFFAHEGLLRQNVLPVLVSINSKDSKVYSTTPQSFYFEEAGNVYAPISPAEAFDIAWQSQHPYVVVKKTLYYTALIAFTIATLGLGSMIWVLPAPFTQPKPIDDPFGRDLIYKSFPKKLDINPGTTSGGMLYFHLGGPSAKPQNADFVIHLLEKSPAFSVESTSVTLRASNEEDEQNTIDVLRNFFY